MRAQLARLGFAEPAVAERRLAGVAARVTVDEALTRAVAESPDPDLALASLARIVERLPDPQSLLGALGADAELRQRLFTVLGSSAALGDHLARHADDWHLLLADEPAPETLLRAVNGAVGPPVLDTLRVVYRRQLLTIAARDLCGRADLSRTAAELADLAAAALEAALTVARAGLPADREPCRLAIIGLGKCGGRELNYVSDVDVVFVAEPMPGGDEARALATAQQLAAATIRACSATTAEGTLWPVDTALRPEGNAGPLVRTLASHVAYYQRWAKTWEFQALLKARPVAGDLDLGGRYVEALAPLVWGAASRPGFVEDVQSMRRRVEASLPRQDADRQLKLGRGGLRDVEFAVQLLQLVHGRTDESLRSGTTLAALEALAAGGYVGRDDAAALADAYRFMRTLEHRLQLHRLRRTHVVPDSAADLRRIGRSLGMRTDPVGALTEEWRRHAREVRRLHEKLFYRPLLHAVARLPPGDARLTARAARDRLEALGYADPPGALRHLEALTTGVSRRAAIQRTLLPVLLGWFADAPNPDAGLLAFRQVSEALGSTHWYLRLLRDEGAAAERLARVLASSRLATDLLLHAPESVAMLADEEELRPRLRAALTGEAVAAARRHDDPEQAVVAVRAMRRRELFRIAVADVLGLLDVETVGAAISDVTAAAIAGALEAAVRAAQLGDGSLPTRVVVIAVGRLGGHEVGYGSDADVLFLHDPRPGVEEGVATDAALRVVAELRRLLTRPAADPPLHVDADLRPEGKQGPLVRTLASYRSYYDRWAAVWERQALLRAEPLAGDADLGDRFVALIDPLRWPAAGLGEAAAREIRRIKARVDAERLPRGIDPRAHLKLGPGGLADVEWTVQLLQLRHAGEHPGLRTTRTLDALRSAAEAGVLSARDAGLLAEAWRTASRLRNAVMLVRGRAADALPSDVRELAGVARLVGYSPGETGAMIDSYGRIMRRARGVVERVFFA